MPYLAVFALLVGALNALQAGANAALDKALQQTVVAGLVISAMGTLTILGAAWWLGLTPRLAVARAAEAPWWAWLGGLAGGGYVLATLLLPQKLGAGLFTALTVTAAVLASLLLDHFALLGFEQRSLGLGRAAGGLLMVAGLVLLAKF